VNNRFNNTRGKGDRIGIEYLGGLRYVDRTVGGLQIGESSLGHSIPASLRDRLNHKSSAGV